MRHPHRCSASCIAPPHVLRRLLETGTGRVREAALNTLLTNQYLRGERSVRSLLAATAAPDTGRRTVYDCRHREVLASASLARTEDGAPSPDEAVNRAFEGFGDTRRFYREVLGRNSIDDRGIRLNGYVHYGSSYQNASWNGQEMVFGDGDGEVFGDFTRSLDVIAHELTHGVVEYTANLEYRGQSGALNESMADVFGSLVKQWKRGQTADEADWLVGSEIFTPAIGADALRSLKAPGTAYDNNLLGRDPQPDHMHRYETLPDTPEGDWGGVHINSGIPNRAFYLAAVAIGGSACDAAGHIWYESLKASTATTQFQEFADTTFVKAGQLYGSGSGEQQAVMAAWREVGIRITGVTAVRVTRRWPDGHSATDGDGMAEFNRRLDSLARQLEPMAREVALLRARS